MVLVGIVDDAQPGFVVYSGSQWTHSNRPSYYNRTVTECQAAAQGTTLPPSFNFSFYGTTVDLYGGPITSTTAFSYSLDGAVLSNAIISPGTVGKIGAKFWGLTGLSSFGEHTLKIVPTAGLFSLDYITFTPTTLGIQVTRNLNVAYDDNDINELKYSGNWSTIQTDIPDGVPFDGTRTGSSTQGNTMKLNFIGSSVTVNGLLNQGPGTLSASFAVDGGKATTFSPFNGSQHVNTSSWAFAQPFYHQDLSPGTHSLVVTVEQATESQILWLDSVVFGATTNTSITDNVTNTGGASSGGPGKKIIIGVAVVAGVIGLLIISAFTQRKKPRPRPGRRPQPVGVEQPSQIIETYIPIIISQPQPQPQRYAPYDPYQYSPIARPDFTYGSEATLPMGDMYSSPPPPQTYHRPAPPPARNEPPRTTYPSPQHVEDGLDFLYDTPQHVEDGLDFTPSTGSRNPQRSTPTSAASTSVPMHRPQDQTQGDGRNSSGAPNPSRPLPRSRSPPQQDGSDGPSQHQPQSSTAPATFGSSQLDGSESFAQEKPNVTVLSYRPGDGSSGVVGARGNVDVDHSTSRVEEEEENVDDEPPPYIL